MTAVEVSGLIQSGILSAMALLLFFRSPSIWQAWLAYVERIRTWDAESDAADRQAQHAIAKENATAMAELTAAVHELREASRDFCRFKG